MPDEFGRVVDGLAKKVGLIWKVVSRKEGAL